MYYSQRCKTAKNKAAKSLFSLMDEKKTNLSVAADIEPKNVLRLVKKIGDHISVLKTHNDIHKGFENITGQLRDLASDYSFMIFEDRKLSDIGNITKKQITQLNGWADFVSVHSIAGPGTINAIKNSIIIAEMTQNGTLAKNQYTKSSIIMGMKNKKNVSGLVTSGKNRIKFWGGFLRFTPGISFSSSGDKFGQKYTTPTQAIKNGSDVIIVGRSICKSKNPLKRAIKYKEMGWEVYSKRSSLV